MFSSAERSIFRHGDGPTRIVADPVAVYRRLLGHPGLNLIADVKALEMLQSNLSKLDAKDADKPESEVSRKVREQGLAAWERLLNATRHAFQVEPLHVDADGTEKGTTDAEVMGLFMAFWKYLDGVKKNTSVTPTSPDSTAPKS